MPEARRGRRAWLGRLAFVAAALASFVAALATVLQQGPPGASNPRRATATAPAAPPAATAGAGPVRRIVFTTQDGTLDSGTVAWSEATGPDAPRTSTGLRCQRVYVAAGQGLCLSTSIAQTVGEGGDALDIFSWGVRALTRTYSAILFDTTSGFQPGRTYPLPGVPSRARVAADGQRAAMTVFVSGDSYLASNFSTRTSVLDLATGEAVDLEQYTVYRGGMAWREQDFNFWGVTFSARDSRRFYATLSSGGVFYLVEGDAVAREVRVLRDGVECPSLSPDGTRIVYKERQGASWQLHVLDVGTLADAPLTQETRSIDDQVEWLDDGHILYGYLDWQAKADVAANVWALAVDNSTPPAILVRGALSPAVVAAP